MESRRKAVAQKKKKHGETQKDIRADRQTGILTQTPKTERQTKQRQEDNECK